MTTLLKRALNSRLLFYIIMFAFKIILDASYVLFVNPVFEYSGFSLHFNITNYLISWLLTFSTIILTPHQLNKLSDYFIITFSNSILLPLYSLYGLNSDLSIVPVMTSFVAYLSIYTALQFKLVRKQISIPFIKGGRKVFQTICFLMIGYLFFWYIVSGAVKNFNLDPLKVYYYRSINSQLTDIGVLAYLNIWVFKVFNLSLLAYALWKKKKILFIILILLQVFFYGVSAHKSVLFTPLIIISIYFYFTHTKSLTPVPFVFSIVTLLSLVLYLYGEQSTYASLFINRVFFIPNYLTYIYFDFFSNNSFSYWSDSFNIFLQPIYPEGIPRTIGNYLGTGEGANNGFISSGYSQAGFLGVAFYVALTIFILKVLNEISRNSESIPLWLALAVVVTPLRTLIISADLMTVILTHGLFVATIMLLLLRKPGNNHET